MRDSQKHPVLVRFLHWLMAIGILGMIASGWYMAGLDESVSYKYDIYFWHKSFGVLVLMAFFVRVLVRLSSRIPPLPPALHNHEKRLAHLVHGLLYLMMFAVPASGYLMSAWGGHGVFLFNLPMPNLVEENTELATFMHEVHILIPYILLGIIALHVLAALKHRLFDTPEKDVIKRML